MIQKVKSLVGRIDCPHCFSLLQWNNKEDVHISNGTKYVICPECGEHIILDKFRDYWVDPNESEGGDESSSSREIVYFDVNKTYTTVSTDYTGNLLENIYDKDYRLKVHFTDPTTDQEYEQVETTLQSIAPYVDSTTQNLSFTLEFVKLPYNTESQSEKTTIISTYITIESSDPQSLRIETHQTDIQKYMQS